MSSLMGTLAFVVLCSLFAFTSGFSKYDRLRRVFDEIGGNPTFAELWRKHLENYRKEEQRSPLLPKFSCHAVPYSNSGHPTSVHKLRPQDVRVIAAMGDSITAGNGILARTAIGVLVEYRGRSWSIGGDKSLDEGVVTLPNILKKYNPRLAGYSLGFGTRLGFNSHLNVAYPGDTSNDMPYQAKMLVNRMKTAAEVDFRNDWKVITLFIGGNDLCDACDNKSKFSPSKYIDNIREALDFLHKEVPRAFVNLVEIFDITPIAHVGINKIFCESAHKLICGCVMMPIHHQLLVDTSRAYQNLTEHLVASGRYDTRPDFTVVLQPFLKNTKIPTKANSTEPDVTYFAPDCFHFSSKGHAAMAHALWNGMLQPVGSKVNSWSLEKPFKCPSEKVPAQGYFRTAINSGVAG